MRNQAVSLLLENIARLLALKGEDSFRLRAYGQAARNIAGLPEDVADYWREGRLEEVPGVGPSIAAKVDEYLSTGRCQYYEDLKAEIAPEAADLLEVPSIGPVRAGEIYRQLGIRTIADLEKAAASGRLRQLPGIGARTEEKILREIANLRLRTRRLLLSVALPAADEVIRLLRSHPAVARIDPAGSLRRLRETVGDLDILAASDRPMDVMAAFTALPMVREVLVVGPTRASVLTAEQLQIDLRVVRPEEYGSALQYFTGSKEHNIALRDVAIARGYKLSEYGVFDQSTGRRVAGATEAEVYKALGLPLVPPELRENRGEIEAALRGKLPKLVELGDIQGDLHVHTNWSDGTSALETMVEAAAARGYRYLAITDHSQGLGVAHGLSIERVRAQRKLIDEVNRRVAPFRVLHGVELDIRSDGSLDYPDEVLADFDIVGVSIHGAFSQPRERMTQRIIRALRSPYVMVLNHPTGRLIDRRPGYELDLEAVIETAAREGVAVEIDGQPDRLDLDDVWSRRAAEAGVLLACDSDAHSIDQLDNLRYAVAVARRAWLRRRDVLNTRSVDDLLDLVRRRRRRGKAA